MKKYRVNVNGSLYEIEIEEMAAPAKMSLSLIHISEPTRPY